MRRLIVVVIPGSVRVLLPALTLVLVGGGLWPSGESQAEAAFPGRNGRIVFSASLLPPGETKDYDLFTVFPNGGGLQRLTAGPEDDKNPKWSPDGRKVLFERTRFPLAAYYVTGAPERDLYVLDLTSQTLTNITNSPLQIEYEPSWSPDGRKIVFAAQAMNDYLTLGDEDLFVVDLQDGDVTPLTDTPNPSESDPVWSPDGGLIAFDSFGSIDVISPDGSGRKRLVSPQEVRATGDGFRYFLDLPTWSPDGRTLAFRETKYKTPGPVPVITEHYSYVWMINRDGSGLARVTSKDRRGEGWYPAWSPDGQRIAFYSSRLNTLATMNLRGGGIVKVLSLSLTFGEGISWGVRP